MTDNEKKIDEDLSDRRILRGKNFSRLFAGTCDGDASPAISPGSRGYRQRSAQSIARRRQHLRLSQAA
jgi:hypothetical protein